MKKYFLLLMLVQGINSQLNAQNSANFSPLESKVRAQSFPRLFWIDLEKGNRVQVEIIDDQSFIYLSNIDSIIELCLADLNVLSDKWKDKLAAKRIEYVMNAKEINTIQVRQNKAADSNFVIMNGQALSLKFEQDTLTIIKYLATAENTDSEQGQSLYRLTFYLNDIADLKKYPDFGLPEKINSLKKNTLSSWGHNSDGTVFLFTDPAVRAKAKQGYLVNTKYFLFSFSMNVQNYKSNLVPSITGGVTLVQALNNSRKEWGLSAEILYSFEKNMQGKIKPFANSFLTVTYDQRLNNNRPWRFGQNLYLSFSWLSRRSGETFDKTSFRVGIGRIPIAKNRVRLEPVFYFHDLLQDLSPGLLFCVPLW